MKAVAGDTHDVVIAGGGVAGATMGRLLAGWGFDVLIVNARAPEKAGEVLGPEALGVCNVLDLTHRFASDRRLACVNQGVVTRWSSGALELLDYSLRGTHGWTIDRPALNAMLAGLAIEKGCQWVKDASAVDALKVADGYEVHVSGARGSRVLRSKVVVDATGRPARIARRLGAARIVDDKLVAASLTLRCGAAPFDPNLHVTILSNGWWYRSDGPNGDTRIAVVSEVNPPTVKRQFLHDVMKHVLRSLHVTEDLDQVLDRLVFLDASSARLDRCAGPGWLAIGDAATAFDPWSGQGLSHAFGTALAAAHALREQTAGNREAFGAYDAAVHMTNRRSRAELALRHAFIASREPAPFWISRRAPCSARTTEPRATTAS